MTSRYRRALPFHVHLVGEEFRLTSNTQLSEIPFCRPSSGFWSQFRPNGSHHNVRDGIHREPWTGRFANELREELNIKSVRFLGVDDGLVEYHFKPNLPILGKKYGRLIPAIKTALAALKGQVATVAARLLESGQPIELLVNGQPLLIQPEKVLVASTSPQGYAVAEGNGLLVALNTTLTPELLLEG